MTDLLSRSLTKQISSNLDLICSSYKFKFIHNIFCKSIKKKGRNLGAWASLAGRCRGPAESLGPKPSPSPLARPRRWPTLRRSARRRGGRLRRRLAPTRSAPRVRARGGTSPAVWCARWALEVPGRVHGGTAAEKSSDEHCAVAVTRALPRLSALTLDSRSSGPGARAEREREGAGRRRRGGARARGVPPMAVRKNRPNRPPYRR
jgi:hypothetical protein